MIDAKTIERLKAEAESAPLMPLITITDLRLLLSAAERCARYEKALQDIVTRGKSASAEIPSVNPITDARCTAWALAGEIATAALKEQA